MKLSDTDTLIRGEYLQPGRAYRLTVTRVGPADMRLPDGTIKAHNYLSFDKTTKRLRLSKANQLTLARAFGDDAANVVGQSVTLMRGPDKQVRGKIYTEVILTCQPPTRTDNATK